MLKTPSLAAVEAAVHEVSKRAGATLTLRQFRILLTLRSGEEVDQIEVRAKTGFSAPATCRGVAQIVSMGLATTLEHPQDRRRRLLQLTRKGEALLLDANLAARASR